MLNSTNRLQMSKNITPHYRSFLQAISWTSLESVYYQTLYALHMFGLYKILDPMVFGTIGTLFSLIYLTITLANLGLDASLPPFFKEATKNGQTAKSFFYSYLVPHYFWLSVILFGVFILILLGMIPAHVSLATITVSLCLILCESLKKTVKAVLRLALYNKMIAAVEMGAITLYISAVYSVYYYFGLLSPALIIGLLSFVSGLSALIFAYTAWHWHLGLPVGNADATKLLAKRFIKSRLFTLCNHLCTDLFSGNMLVPYIAMHSGLSHAGIFKLLATVAHNITTVMRNVFGVSSSAFFAHRKHHSNQEKQAVLQYISYLFFCGLSILAIGSILYTVYLCCSRSVDYSLFCSAVLFMLLVIGQNVVLVVEKFLIVQEKASSLSILYATTMIITCCILYLFFSAPLSVILIMLLLLRTATVIYITQKIDSVDQNKNTNILPPFLKDLEYDRVVHNEMQKN